ncbi:hypothetical protein SLA2020_148890 [Shorea laevis]
MEVINCSWVQQVDGRKVKYHFQFEPITSSTYGGQEDEDGLHSELFDHSVVLWNARGSLRSHFWEVVNFLHHQTLPDVMIIFNTAVAEDRIIGVGNDQIMYDEVFIAPAINKVGGIMCQWYKSRVNVACVKSDISENASYISISITPRRHMGLSTYGPC